MELLLIILFIAAGAAIVWALLLRSPRSERENFPRCGRCGYNLTGCTSNRCPECGTLFIEAGVELFRPTRLGRRIAVLLVAFLGICVGATAIFGCACRLNERQRPGAQRRLSRCFNNITSGPPLMS